MFIGSLDFHGLFVALMFRIYWYLEALWFVGGVYVYGLLVALPFKGPFFEL